MKIIDATFGEAIALQNGRVLGFVTTIGTKFSLTYNTSAQLLEIRYPGHPTKLVGFTNIKMMTLAEDKQEVQVERNTKAKTSSK